MCARSTDYFAIKESLPKHKLLVFTGPIDAYYASLGMPKLEYRSLRFEKEYHEPEGGYYQEALQVSRRGNRHTPTGEFRNLARS